MSLSDNKKSVLDTIGAYSSLNQNEDKSFNQTKNSFSSVNNKKETIPYLLDVLKTVAGTEALKQLVGTMFSNFIEQTEPKLKKTLKKQFVQYNSDNTLPSNFKNNGVSIPVENLDTKSKFKTNPDSSTGSLLYDNTKPNFDKIGYQAILNEGTDIPYNNLLVNYNKNTDSFIFKPNISTNPNVTVNNWFTDYIDKTEIINKKEVMTGVIDYIFGSVTSNQNKTDEQIKNELEVDKLLEQLIDNNDSFQISQEDLDAIEKKANDLINGITYYDMGCGVISANLSLSGMSSLISNISGSTNGFEIANAIENSIDQASNSDQQSTDENKETIKDGFFNKIIKIFVVKISNSLTTAPQIRMLLGISSSFQNNGNVILTKTKDDLQKYKVIIKCIINDIIKLVGEFIFNLAVSYLIKLLTPIIKKIIKEKINQFKRIIKSLIST